MMILLRCVKKGGLKFAAADNVKQWWSGQLLILWSLCGMSVD